MAFIIPLHDRVRQRLRQDAKNIPHYA